MYIVGSWVTGRASDIPLTHLTVLEAGNQPGPTFPFNLIRSYIVSPKQSKPVSDILR